MVTDFGTLAIGDRAIPDLRRPGAHDSGIARAIRPAFRPVRARARHVQPFRAGAVDETDAENSRDLVHHAQEKKPKLFHAGIGRHVLGDRGAKRNFDAVKKALNLVGRRCRLRPQQGAEDRMLVAIAEPRVADATSGHRKNDRRE